MTTKTIAPIIIDCLDPIIHTDEQPVCSDPTCPCHSEKECARCFLPTSNYQVKDRSIICADCIKALEAEYAERLYTEQGMVESRESLPWYGGMLDIEAVEHAPWCDCPRCRSGEPEEDEGDGEQEGYDEHPFL